MSDLWNVFNGQIKLENQNKTLKPVKTVYCNSSSELKKKKKIHGKDTLPNQTR